MKCNQCGDVFEVAGHVFACKTCRDDGTANEIPKDMNGETEMSAVLERKPGLAARFVAEAQQQQAEGAAEEQRDIERESDTQLLDELEERDRTTHESAAEDQHPKGKHRR